MKNPKSKGSNFERQICKALSLWVTKGARSDVFWRSALSGGRATIALSKGQEVRQSGDLVAVAPEGYPFAKHYYCEMKHYFDLDIASFLIKDKGKLAMFWRHTVAQARKHDKKPLIVARQNNYPIVVLTQCAMFSARHIAEIRDTRVWLFTDVIKSECLL